MKRLGHYVAAGERDPSVTSASSCTLWTNMARPVGPSGPARVGSLTNVTTACYSFFQNSTRFFTANRFQEFRIILEVIKNREKNQ